MKNHELRYNIYFEIELLCFISRLMGLAPFSIKTANSAARGKSFQYSDIILTTFQTILILVGFCISELFVAVIDEPVLLSTIRTMWFISSVSYHTTCIVTLILNVTIHRQYLPRILNSINVIDSKLCLLDNREKLFRTRRSLRTKQLSLITLILGINSALSFCFSFNRGIVYNAYTILRTLCNVIFFLIIFQYITLVLVLKTRYEQINSTLSKLLFTDGTSHDVSVKFNSHRRLSILAFNLDVKSRTEDVFMIRDLRQIYSQLHDVLLLINKYYGTTIILVIISILLNLTPSIYLGIIVFKDTIVYRHELKQYIELVLLLCWCVSIIFMYVWLNSCCHLVTDEVYKLMVCIHRIQLLPNVTYGTVVELNAFTNQLRDIRVEFSVCGLFALNLQFLCASFGVITSYILVLIQL